MADKTQNASRGTDTSTRHCLVTARCGGQMSKEVNWGALETNVEFIPTGKDERLSPEAAAVVNLPVSQTLLYEVNRLEAEGTHRPAPQASMTVLFTGFQFSQALKAEEKPGSRTRGEWQRERAGSEEAPYLLASQSFMHLRDVQDLRRPRPAGTWSQHRTVGEMRP